MIRGQVPAGQPGAEGLRADIGERADVAPERVGELLQRPGPADLHRPERRPRSGQRQHGPGALRPVTHQRRQRGVRPALRPPVLSSLVCRPLRGGVHVRVDAPPAAGVPGREPGLPGQFQAAVRLGQPQGDGRPRLPGPAPPRGRRRRCRRRRARPPRRPRPGRPGGSWAGCSPAGRPRPARRPAPFTRAGNCCPVICAASSARLVPDSAERWASWACASAGEQRSRSISMPRARSTTERAAAPDCILSSSRRCRAIRALSRSNSAPLGTVTVVETFPGDSAA